jgi:hypothetical protein
MKTCDYTTTNKLLIYLILIPLSSLIVGFSIFLVLNDAVQSIETPVNNVEYYPVPAVPEPTGCEEAYFYGTGFMLISCDDGTFKLLDRDGNEEGLNGDDSLIPFMGDVLIVPDDSDHFDADTWADADADATADVRLVWDFADADPIGVEYNCVDVALNILTILERHDDLDDVYAMAGWDIDLPLEGHVQVVRKSGDSITPLVRSGYFVIPGEQEVSDTAWYKFYSPEQFRAAAMKHEHLTIDQLERFNSIERK